MSFVSSTRVRPQGLFVRLFRFPYDFVVPGSHVGGRYVSLTFGVMGVYSIGARRATFCVCRGSLYLSLFRAFGHAIRSL